MPDWLDSSVLVEKAPEQPPAQPDWLKSSVPVDTPDWLKSSIPVQPEEPSASLELRLPEPGEPEIVRARPIPTDTQPASTGKPQWSTPEELWNILPTFEQAKTAGKTQATNPSQYEAEKSQLFAAALGGDEQPQGDLSGDATFQAAPGEMQQELPPGAFGVDNSGLRSLAEFYGVGKQRALTFTEEAQRGGASITDLVPFAGSVFRAQELFEISQAAGRLTKHGENHYEGREQDEKQLLDYLVNENEKAERGTTLGAKVGGGLFQLPAFMGEFLATGGLANLGKKFALETTKKVVGASLKRKAIKWAAKTAAGALMRTVGNPQRVAEAYYRQRVGGLDAQQTPEGRLLVKESQEKPFTSALKAFGDVWVEMFSEETGEIIGKGLGAIGKRIPILRSLWKAKTGGSSAAFAQKMSRKVGFNGVINEIGEERVGQLMRAALGIEKLRTPKPTELLAELLTFSVPGAARFAAGRVSRGQQITPPPPATPITPSSPVAEAAPIDPATLLKPASRKQKAMAHAIANKTSIPEDAYRKLAFETTGKQSMAEMNTAEASRFINALQPGAQPVVQTEPTPETSTENIEIYNNIRNDEKLLVAPSIYSKEAIEKYLTNKYGHDPEITLYRGISPTTKPTPGVTADTSSKVGLYWTPDYNYAQTFATGSGALHQVKVKASDLLSKGGGHFVSEKEIWLWKKLQANAEVAPPADPTKAVLPTPFEVETPPPKTPEQQRLRAVAGSEAVFNQAMDYGEALGGIPTNPKLVKTFYKDLEVAASKMAKRQKEIFELASIGKVPNLLNYFSSARYAVAEAELHSGVPMQALYTGTVQKSNAASQTAQDVVEGALRRAGTTPFKFSMTFQENEQIGEWLYEDNLDQREIVWGDMNDQTRAIATELQAVLQNESANAIREARWRIWERVDRSAQSKIEQINQQISETENQAKKDKLARRVVALEEEIDSSKPPNAPDEALAQGRNAKADGRLADWIDGETWGTRKFYYMSEQELDDLVSKNMPSGISETLEQVEKVGAGGKPSVRVEGAATREGRPVRLKGQPVVNAVTHHMERAMVANATADDVEQLWSNFSEANPSRRDVDLMRRFMDTALGKQQKADPVTALAQKANRVWWRFHFLSPIKSAFFFTRNAAQNIAFSASQLPPSRLISSAAKVEIRSLRSPLITRLYNRDWRPKISQKRQIGRNFLRLEEGNVGKEVGNRAAILMDIVGQAAIYSDELNRLAIWPTMVQAGDDLATSFLADKISYGRLSSSLRLETLNPAQRLELKELLDKGDKLNFVSRFAEFKTENIHFRYETPLRSGLEQHPAGRTFVGLVTYPRGYIEIAYQNAVKPLLQGVATKNVNQAAQGATALAWLFIGASAAKWIVKAITGRDAYDPLDTATRYTPIAPGVSNLKETWDTVQEIQSRADNNNWSVAETANALGSVLTGQLEHFIIGSDVYLNIYEANNDVRGVRVWTLVKKQLTDEYSRLHGKPFKKASRDTVESTRHIIFGGDEKPPRDMPDDLIAEGKVNEAAKQLEIILNDASDAEELSKLFRRVRQSASRSSPWGHVAVRNRADFLSRMSKEERQQFIKGQREYMRNYNMAIRAAMQETRKNRKPAK